MAHNGEILRAASLSSLMGIRHGFFTRQGGVSRGIYTSLNCGLGSMDDPTLCLAAARTSSRSIRSTARPRFSSTGRSPSAHCQKPTPSSPGRPGW